MEFRVDGLSKAYETKTNAVSKSRKVEQNAASKAQQKEDSYDSLALSNDAKTLSFAIKTVSQAPDVREDKVNAIKKSIEDGTYSVSAEAVAKKILNQ